MKKLLSLVIILCLIFVVTQQMHLTHYPGDNASKNCQQILNSYADFLKILNQHEHVLAKGAKINPSKTYFADENQARKIFEKYLKEEWDCGAKYDEDYNKQKKMSFKIELEGDQLCHTIPNQVNFQENKGDEVKVNLKTYKLKHVVFLFAPDQNDFIKFGTAYPVPDYSAGKVKVDPKDEKSGLIKQLDQLPQEDCYRFIEYFAITSNSINYIITRDQQQSRRTQIRQFKKIYDQGKIKNVRIQDLNQYTDLETQVKICSSQAGREKIAISNSAKKINKNVDSDSSSKHSERGSPVYQTKKSQGSDIYGFDFRLSSDVKTFSKDDHQLKKKRQRSGKQGSDSSSSSGYSSESGSGSGSGSESGSSSGSSPSKKQRSDIQRSNSGLSSKK